jgi:predicted permease
MLITLVNVILPIFAVMAAGMLYGRKFSPDAKTFSSSIIYLFAPALVIDGFQNVRLDADAMIQIVALVVLSGLLITLISYAAAHILRLDHRATSTLVLSVLLFNGANYGIPFNTFAYGIDAERLAVIYYSASIILVNTLGVYIASRGASGEATVRTAALNILRTPLFYATLIGLMINFGGITLPLPIARSVHVLGTGMIPVMLILIGIQISTFEVKTARLLPVAVATFLCLVIAPLVAWGISGLLGMDGLTRIVGITQHAMPTAVIGVALTTQFEGDVELITTTLLVSTLTSAFTLSLLVQMIA